ncbi:DUF4832 domain-containing protein [Actinomyces capricornis]|uniref:DUF4832 domain-containing protein n=1 Tax=Actinomyces capricornis TaxID=2755559 RepID=A0ABN6K6R9_9ACTO|nr:DUF4832 domain-containing protein [Actinomyces capricornis]BDA64317.1 hypothetical protein MANAM107_11510 [Actinomyces capricornis]
MKSRNDGTPAAESQDSGDSTGSSASGPCRGDPQEPGAGTQQEGRGLWTRPRIVVAIVSITAIICFAAGLRAYLPRESWIEVGAGPSPASNPLKGMMPFAPADPDETPQLADSAPPHTMEWIYIPLNEVVTGPDSYDWQAVEAHLEAISSRGHQTVLRFYVDYPGRPSALPDYLVEEGRVRTRSYTVNGNNGASVSPDYNDPDMMEMLTSFISAFGQEYDGDPRLGFITQGLVGFWGEGHTWPMNGMRSPANPSGENWMPTEANQEALVAAWDEAFDTTPTLARYPTSASAEHAVGYHDDSFGYATLDNADWHFMSLMKRAGATAVWQTQPIGGEVYPEIQDCVLVSPSDCPQAAREMSSGRNYDVPGSIRATHASWLINNWAFTAQLDTTQQERALEASRATGYELAVTRWRMDEEQVEVELTNHGVAPFYYDWDLEVIALDGAGQEVARTTLDGDLRTVLPGEEVAFSGEVSTLGATTVLLRAVNPMEDGAPLRFASAGQDTTWEGYLTLGTVEPEED